MNRRGFLTGISAFGAGAFLFYVQPAEEQIADLQEDVHALGERVSVLESQVNELFDGDADDAETISDTSVATGDVTVNGAGTHVSEKFGLAAGQYRVNAFVDVVGDFDGFAVFVYDSSGSSELLFNELIDQSGLWEGSAIYQAVQGGEHYVAAENTTSAWTLTFEQY